MKPNPKGLGFFLVFLNLIGTWLAPACNPLRSFALVLAQQWHNKISGGIRTESFVGS